jgi:hypothetical protein
MGSVEAYRQRKTGINSILKDYKYRDYFIGAVLMNLSTIIVAFNAQLLNRQFKKGQGLSTITR